MSHKKSPELVRRAIPAKRYKLATKPGAHPLSGVKQLEGAVSINLLRPTPLLNSLLRREGPDICLLDDLHRGRNKCESCNPDEGCFSLYKEEDISFLRYIDQVAAETGVVTDLFLEYWSPLSQAPVTGADNSALIDTIMSTLGCRPRSAWSSCPLPHIRVHMADVRRFYEMKPGDAAPRSPQDKYLGDTLYEVYVKHRGNRTFKKYCDRAFPDIPIAHIKELIYEYFDIETTPEIIRERFLSDPFFKQYSRIHHELSQLPTQVRLDLEKHFLLPIQGSELQTRYMYIKYGIMPQERLVPRITFCPMDFSSMMDIYAISRLLKVPKPGVPSQLGIFYMGGAHCRKIANRLVQMGYYENVGFYGEDITQIMKGLTTREDIINYLAHQNKCIRDIAF